MTDALEEMMKPENRCTEDDAKAAARCLTKVIRVMDEFRDYDHDMPIQYAETFVFIAIHEELPMSSLMELTGLAQSSVSRNVAALSKFKSYKKPGHDLVEAIVDPQERRRKIIRLTPKGKRLRNKLLSIVGD